MSVFIEGVAAQFYRGIGDEVQSIGPFSQVNFFIGANNSGKSIVLNLLASQLPRPSAGGRKPLQGPEIYRGRNTGEFRLAVGTSASVVESALQTADFNERTRSARLGSIPVLQSLREICKRVSRHGLIWVDHFSEKRPALFFPVKEEEAIRWPVGWQDVWTALTGSTRGEMSAHWLPQTLDCIARAGARTFSEVYLVPAKRVLGGKGEEYQDQSGRGLIDRLAMVQSPDWDRQADRQEFQRINAFLQEVTGKRDARLEVPSERQHLLVHMDNKVLPLASLGTGIHEVVLIAAFCTIHDGSIMCIEEPEIHLHPLLQKKLINYLIENTTSQYFVATHSAAFIDTPGASIFRVTNDGEQTRIKAALTKNDQRETLDELGYLASDILQANAVIWVEGPSDRTYLNHWIKAADGDLEEGIHYAMMFYGGALIRHLSASDEAVDEFIKLRDLNRNMAIVMDSDRETAEGPLKPHAQRLLDEMNRDGGVVWITAGREVENYVDGKKLQNALQTLHPRLYVAPCRTRQYDHAFYFYRDDPNKKGQRITYKEGDKVGAATLICKEAAVLDVLDLRARLTDLTAMVRKANGLPPKESSLKSERPPVSN